MFMQGKITTLVSRYIEEIAAFIKIPFAALLTDENGLILEIFNYSLPLDTAEISIGKSLALRNAGITAVSRAIENNGMERVCGCEQSRPALQNWNCVSAPVCYQGRTLGFVNLSFQKDHSAEFAAPLLHLLCSNVSRHCEQISVSPETYSALSHLEKHWTSLGLSPRELQAARLWFSQKSALYIASELGIKEGTVRNMIQRIYTKTNVSDRSSFIKKFQDPFNS